MRRVAIVLFGCALIVGLWFVIRGRSEWGPTEPPRGPAAGGRGLRDPDGAHACRDGTGSLRRDHDLSHIWDGIVRAEADAGGNFTLDPMIPGESPVWVLGGGWVSEELLQMTGRDVETRTRVEVTGESTPVELRAVRTGAVEGVALSDSGEPLAGALVSVSTSNEWRGFRHKANGTTDSKGRFRYEDLIPGFPYELSGRRAAEFAGRSLPFEVEAGQTTTLDLEIPEARWLEVRVREEETDAPLAGAEVVIVDSAPAVFGLTSRSSAEGLARLGPLSPGAFSIRVSHPDCIPSDGSIEVPGASESGPLPPLEVRLRMGAAISGTIFVEEGLRVPVSTCRVRAKPVNAADTLVRRFTSGTEPSPDGSFQISGLRPGVYELSVTSRFATGGRSSSQDLPILAGCKAETGTTGIVFRIDAASLPEKGPKLTLEVFGPGGTSAAKWNRLILVNGLAKSFESWTNTIQFPPDGPAAVQLYVSNATDADGNRLGAGLFGPYDVRSGTVRIQLPEPRTIEGVVLDPSGSPFRGLIVRARPVGPGPESGGVLNCSEEARTDEQGKFRIEGLGDGEHRLEIPVPPGYVREPERTVTAGEAGLEIRLREAGTVRVSVVDDAGSPVVGASVRVISRLPDRITRAVTTDESGVAVFRNLDPDGQYDLYVSGGRRRRAYLRMRPRKWTPEDTTVSIQRAQIVKGVVLDREGKGCANASVWRLYRDGSWRSWGAVSEDGSFLVHSVDAPTVILRATVAGGNPEEPGADEQVVNAGATNIVFHIDTGASLTVNVTNWPEQGQVSADLFADGHVRIGVSKTPGELRFFGLRTGTDYTLRIVTHSPGSLARQKDGVRADGAPLRVELGPAEAITGKLMVAEGAEHATVWAGLGGLFVTARVASDGTFTLDGLVNGTWEIRGRAMVDGAWWEGRTESPVGATAELELRPRDD